MTEIISIILLFFSSIQTNSELKNFKNLHSWFPCSKCSKFLVWKSQIIYLCYTYIISNFSTLDFHIWKIKKRAALLIRAISNFLLSFFTLIFILYPASVTMFWIFYSLTVGRDPKMITISWSHYDMLPPWGCSIYIFF